MADSEQHVARLGSSVLIDLNNGDKLTFARLHPSATIKMGNTRCSLSPLVDSPYGSAFELQRSPNGPSLVRIPTPNSSEPVQIEAPAIDCDSPQISSLRDNRSLVDDNTAQKLSAHDIDRMRKNCNSGKDIVDALIANSTTFHSKTTFSQEKYKKKKQKKYAPFFIMRRPSARRICEAYLSKSPQKIGFLRMDMMALMLSLGNVAAHAEVLVMDMVGGLLTAAVTERTGGFGSVCSVYCTPKPPPLEIVGLLNLSHSMASRVYRTSVWELLSTLNKKVVCGDVVIQTTALGEKVHESEDVITNNLQDGSGDVCRVENEGIDAAGAEGSLPAASEGVADADANADEGFLEQDEHPAEANVSSAVKLASASGGTFARHGRNPAPEDFSRWAKNGFTSLLIGAPEIEPWSALQELLPLLCPSSPFVIYHRYLQPLAQCMHELQVNKMTVALEIIEPWLREYQVLPSRTHPQMQMNANGGYILTGIKIASV